MSSLTVMRSLQVYLDAPNNASGPLPADVPTEVFKGPYFEWWNAQQVPVSSCLHG